MTEETRMTILGIKESLAEREEVRGIDIYRAVIRDGVGTTQEFINWTGKHDTSSITH